MKTTFTCFFVFVAKFTVWTLWNVANLKYKTKQFFYSADGSIFFHFWAVLKRHTQHLRGCFFCHFFEDAFVFLWEAKKSCCSIKKKKGNKSLPFFWFAQCIIRTNRKASLKEFFFCFFWSMLLFLLQQTTKLNCLENRNKTFCYLRMFFCFARCIIRMNCSIFFKASSVAGSGSRLMLFSICLCDTEQFSICILEFYLKTNFNSSG